MAESGMWEMVLIFVLALLVLGPERLPVVARKVGFWIGKTRRFINSVKSDVEREFRSDELERLMQEQSKEIQNLRTMVTESAIKANKIAAETGDEIRQATDVPDAAPPQQIEKTGAPKSSAAATGSE